MRPENLQQVANGSHTYKMDFGNDFEVPNWIRKKVRFALGRQFLQEVEKMNAGREVSLKPPGFRWMYNVMDCVSTKDMVSLAGLDNIDVTGKQAFESLGDLLKNLLERRDMDIPEHLRAALPKVDQDLHNCKKCLRRRIEDNLKDSDPKSSHCLKHALNPDEECEHNHGGCEFCLKPFYAIELCSQLLDLLPENVDKDEKAFMVEELQSIRYDIEAFAGHVVRAIVQGDMQNSVIENMGNARKVFCKSGHKLAPDCGYFQGSQN